MNIEVTRRSQILNSIFLICTTLLICLISVWPNVYLMGAALTCCAIQLTINLKSNRWRTDSPGALIGYGVLFLLTAAYGYWGAYSSTNAFPKLIMLLTACGFALALATSDHKDGSLINAFAAGSIFFAAIFVGVKVQLVSDAILLTPNRLAGLSAVLAPFLIAALLTTQRFIIRFALGGGAILILAVLILSGSRGALAALIIGVSLGTVYVSERTTLAKYRSRIISGTVGAILIIGAIGLSFINTVQKTPLNNIAGASSRIELYVNTQYLLQEFWVFGGGLNSFGGLYSQYILSVPFLLFTYGHNLYLDLLLEQGTLGLFSFFGIFLSAIALLLQTKATDKYIAGACLASIVVLLTHGLIDDAVYGDIGSPLLFAAPALAFGIASKRSADTHWPIHLSYLIVTVGAIFILTAAPAAGRTNLVATSIAKIQLKNWPTGEWSRYEQVAELEPPKTMLKTLVEKHPTHGPIFYKLGLIALEEKEFKEAVQFLAQAAQLNPGHPGIQKNLAYAHAWAGDLQEAEEILLEMPWAEEELFAYIWWWNTLDESELSENARALHEAIVKGLN